MKVAVGGLLDGSEPGRELRTPVDVGGDDAGEAALLGRTWKRGPRRLRPAPGATVHDEVVRFWFGSTDLWSVPPSALRQRWFQGGPAFDDEVRRQFGVLFDDLSVVDTWTGPAGRLAAILVTDQFSRQLFRRTARAFASDAHALRLADDALSRGWDREVGPVQRGFVYLPLMHAEDLAVADRSVTLYQALSEDPTADDGVRAQLGYAVKHRDIVARFGRYPGRNPALGRTDTAEELTWLEAGGDTFGAR